MNFFRVVLILMAGCGLLRAQSPVSGDVSSPFSPAPQFSADIVVTTDKGQNITQTVHKDGDKIRTEMNMNGMQMVMIVRPDLQKLYQVMVAQKMVMVMPYDPSKFKKQMAAAAGPEGKFDLIGPDTVEGVACTKYKVTSGDNKVFFLWIDAASKAPVRMTAEDSSVTILWKNYKVGPQDAALFEPPAGYQVMAMPSMPGTPGAPGGGGQ